MTVNRGGPSPLSHEDELDILTVIIEQCRPRVEHPMSAALYAREILATRDADIKELNAIQRMGLTHVLYSWEEMAVIADRCWEIET